MRQRHVPLEQARNGLSRLVDAAHAGSRITLTKHGRPWAQLMPVEAAGPRNREPARWAGAGMDLDPYLLIPAEHRVAVQQHIGRQAAANPYGSDPPGLSREYRNQRLLLDTHVLQWWWCSPALLSPRIRSLLRDPASQLWISAVSALELSAAARGSGNQALLAALSRLQLDLDDEGLPLLPLHPQHLHRACRGPLATLELHDAALLAQAECEGMRLISADPALGSQGQDPLW